MMVTKSTWIYAGTGSKDDIMEALLENNLPDKAGLVDIDVEESEVYSHAGDRGMATIREVRLRFEWMEEE